MQGLTLVRACPVCLQRSCSSQQQKQARPAHKQCRSGYHSVAFLMCHIVKQHVISTTAPHCVTHSACLLFITLPSNCTTDQQLTRITSKLQCPEPATSPVTAVLQRSSDDCHGILTVMPERPSHDAFVVTKRFCQSKVSLSYVTLLQQQVKIPLVPFYIVASGMCTGCQGCWSEGCTAGNS